MNGGLRKNIRRRSMPEDVSPLEGSVNIVDAMLVFACGLMLSLVMHWNVDLGGEGGKVDLERGQEVSQEQFIQEELIKTEGQSKEYEVMGTVYKDPATGQLFMLTNQ